MPTFGASHVLHDSSGHPVQIIAETDEICTICEDACTQQTGTQSTFAVIRYFADDTAALSCPYCGQSKTVWKRDVKLKRGTTL